MGRAPAVLAVLAGSILAYDHFSAHLWREGLWWDVAWIAFVLMPLTFSLVLIALPLTWLPDIMLLFVSAFPGVTLAGVLVLMLMHVVAVAGLLTLLPRLLCG